MKPYMTPQAALAFTGEFYFYLITATLLFLVQQKRRRWMPARFFLIVSAAVGSMFYMEYAMYPNHERNALIYSTALFFMWLMDYSCFEISRSEALFCTLAGYGVQFIGSMVRECAHTFFPKSLPVDIILFFVTMGIYLIYYMIYGCHLQRGQNFDLRQSHLLALSCVVVAVEIVICYWMRLQWRASGDWLYMLCDSILLIVSTICILAMQFNIMIRHNLEHEMETITRMWMKDQEQYRISSDTIDQINRKCHDMRHQIRSIGSSANVDAHALKEIEQTIRIYDSMFQTGSRALDVILTEKNMYCQENGITLNCIADGSSLDFMQDSDIYSLFGNLLENAFNAVRTLDESQRTVDLSIRRHSELLSISVRNCYEGTVTMENGRPVSSGDPRYHGFGTKSIAAIAAKYDGTISFRAVGGTFSVNMLFPLRSEKAADKATGSPGAHESNSINIKSSRMN